MPGLNTLHLESFRNISDISLSFSDGFNVFSGKNGSGKTSLLEAIYFLAFNRSFRTHLPQRIIQHERDKFLIFASTNKHHIGLERDHKQFRIHLDQQEIKSITPIAKILPLQIIHAHTYQLLEAGPEKRRQFIDWGVFHVEHQFISTWRRYNKAIKQRNSALKQGCRSQELAPWNIELIETGKTIDSYRKRYLELFLPIFKSVFGQLLSLENIELIYSQGWPKDKTFEDALLAYQENDKLLGYTQLGPHRADLKLYIDRIPVKDTLSRGQQKLFVSAMQLAQGILMKERLNIAPIYLIDDLSAELDEDKRFLFCQILQKLEAQVFLTCIDLESLAPFLEKTSARMFHVEHGEISVT